jgi:hypothetical protein
LALITWVTLEDTGEFDDGEPRPLPLKHWAVVVLDRLPGKERRLALEEFSRYGNNWQPNLD